MDALAFLILQKLYQQGASSTNRAFEVVPYISGLPYTDIERRNALTWLKEAGYTQETYTPRYIAYVGKLAGIEMEGFPQGVFHLYIMDAGIRAYEEREHDRIKLSLTTRQHNFFAILTTCTFLSLILSCYQACVTSRREAREEAKMQLLRKE